VEFLVQVAEEGRRVCFGELGTVWLEDVLDVEGVQERLFGEDFHDFVDAVTCSLFVKCSVIDEKVFDLRAEIAQGWGHVTGFPRCLFLDGFGSVDPICGFFDGGEESGVPVGWGDGGCGREKDE
jgi:hypothetical protein